MSKRKTKSTASGQSSDARMYLESAEQEVISARTGISSGRCVYAFERLAGGHSMLALASATGQRRLT